MYLSLIKTIRLPKTSLLQQKTRLVVVACRKSYSFDERKIHKANRRLKLKLKSKNDIFKFKVRTSCSRIVIVTVTLLSLCCFLILKTRK